MILIIDNERSKPAKDLKCFLESCDLPVVMTDVSWIKDYPVFLAAVAFVRSESELNIISLRAGKCLLLAINDSGSRIYNSDVVFYEKQKGTVADFVLGHIKGQFDIDPRHLHSGDLLIEEDVVKYGVSFMKLTATERRILVLFTILRERWVNEYSVLKSCFKNSDRRRSDKVPVHICNLNKKAKTLIGKPIILCKRGVGYTLDLTI